MATKIAWKKRKERYGESGCRFPEMRKKKISESCKKHGQKPETREKRREDRKRRKLEKGYINSPETRKKISEIWKEKWRKGEVTERQRQNLILSRIGGKKTEFKKGHSVPQRWRDIVKKSRALQIFPKQDTKIEIKVQDYLKDLKVEFFAHHYIGEIDLPYRCDIYIPSLNLVIECDGDYWHGNPDMYSDQELNDYQKKQKERDKKRTKQLLIKGYKVLRIWEIEIKKMELEDFKDKLKEVNNGL